MDANGRYAFEMGKKAALRGGQPRTDLRADIASPSHVSVPVEVRTDSYDWRKGGLCHGPCAGHCGFGHLRGCDSIVQWLRENPPSEWEGDTDAVGVPKDVLNEVREAMENSLRYLEPFTERSVRAALAKLPEVPE